MIIVYINGALFTILSGGSNGGISESFNGKLRDELLNREIFYHT